MLQASMLYAAMLRCSFRQQTAYRANSLLLLCGSFVKLFILVSVWRGLYGDNASINGIAYAEVLLFVIVNLLASTLTASAIGGRMGEKVSSGAIGVDLLRPASLKFTLISEQLGENAFRLLFSTLPACLLYMALLGWPSSSIGAAQAALFAVGITGGIILIYQIHYLLGLTSFWTGNSYYIDWFMRAFIELFAGTFVPLWFYPQILLNIGQYLPFRLMTFEPIALLVGNIRGWEAAGSIAQQWGWIAVLWLAERWVWRKAQSKVFVQGG
jgi:ABC-type uncharacterized transport system, permease component